ncbi:hypothetical protein AAG906_010309 [Vitis piasezkii]
MVTSLESAPAEVDSDELNQQGHPNNGVQASQSDQKGIGPSAVVERSSEDGYNWRKYGQKHVKLFERAHDGQIVEIIYKAHDHPKPQPSRRYASGAILQEERPDKVSSLIGRDVTQHIWPDGPQSTPMAPELSPVAANDDVVEGAILDEVDEDDPLSKRRKMEIGGIDVTPVVKPIREPRVVVQTLSEVDILDDGYRGANMGRKCARMLDALLGSMWRASHDPKAVITTYEGKHNHDVPTARTNSHDAAGQVALNGMPMIRSEENDTIKNLGESRSFETPPLNHSSNPCPQNMGEY